MEIDKGKETMSEDSDDLDLSKVAKISKGKKMLKWSPELLIYILENEGLTYLLELDPKQYLQASKDSKHYCKSIPDSIPLIIKDEKSGHYVKADDPKKYFQEAYGKLATGVPMHHNEILRKNHGRKLYVPLISETSNHKVKEISNLLIKYMHDHEGMDITCSVRKNLKTFEYDIVANEKFMKNAFDAKNLIDKFWRYLPEKLAKYINIRSAFEDISDTAKPTIFSPDHKSEIKDEFLQLMNATTPDQEKQIELLIKSLLSQSNGNVIVNLNVNNIVNPVRCEINNFKAQQIIKPKNKEDDVYDFIDFIKRDKPSWYVPGTFIPKALLAQKFNEKYDHNISTRTFIPLLKKCHVKDLIIGEEKNGKYFSDTFGEFGRTYRGFIAKTL